MTKRDNDDLAAALAGLHSGDHHDDGHAHDTSHGEQVHLEGVHEAPAPAAPPAPRAGRPAAPAGSGAARPVSPGAAPSPPPASVKAPSVQPAPPAAGAVPLRPGRPATPSSRPAARPSAPARPSSPARPPAAARPAAPARPSSPAGPARPASPQRSDPPAAGGTLGAGAAVPPVTPRRVEPPARDVAQQADAVAHVVEDDDSVIVPPPPIEYLGHSHPHHPAHGGARVIPRYQSLGYRRTLIPIMLTTGLCLIVMGFTRWVCGRDTLLGAQPVWMAVAWFVFGGLALLLGLLNMIQVKALMDAPAERPG